MSEQQVAEFYELVTRAKVPRPPVDRVFHRGWNAGIDFAIRAMRTACDEPVSPDPDHPPAP